MPHVLGVWFTWMMALVSAASTKEWLGIAAAGLGIAAAVYTIVNAHLTGRKIRLEIRHLERQEEPNA